MPFRRGHFCVVSMRNKDMSDEERNKRLFVKKRKSINKHLWTLRMKFTSTHFGVAVAECVCREILNRKPERLDPSERALNVMPGTLDFINNGKPLTYFKCPCDIIAFVC